MSEFKYKEIRAELWPDFERLFGDNGACGGCWCQWWRVPKGGRSWDLMKYDIAKQVTRDLILNNKMTGLLAYDGEIPIGWCSFGPRSVFLRIDRMKAYKRDDTEKVWSINCFFIDRKYRRQGLARFMLESALKCLRKRKVKLVEGYPVTLTKDGKQLPPAFSYTGPLKIFEEAGFEIIQTISPSRPLVRKIL